MKKERLIQMRRRQNGERGFALLEYCAGATMMIVVVWAAVQLMGTNVGEMINAIGDWAKIRATEIRGGTAADAS